MEINSWIDNIIQQFSDQELYLQLQAGTNLLRNQKYDMAINIYQQCAQKNNWYAFLKLGQMYHFGVGVKQNFLKAMEFYIKSVNTGRIMLVIILEICIFMVRELKKMN